MPVCQVFLSSYLSFLCVYVGGRAGGLKKRLKLNQGRGGGVGWWKEIPSYPFIFLRVCAKNGRM